jgi:hypothetical protein
MDKINFRFNLLKARFPDLYNEAENKIAGGVDRKDIVADWLNELICRRNANQITPTEKTIAIETVDDIDLAKSVMDALTD